MNTQHQLANATSVLQRIEAERKARKAAAFKKWREANREYHRECAAKWHEENGERKAALNKKWREANPERKAAAFKKWREENREHVAATSKNLREAKGWEAQLAVVARGGGDAAGRAARAANRRQSE